MLLILSSSSISALVTSKCHVCLTLTPALLSCAQVNLKTPDLTILVQLARNVCAASVVPKYRELHKFNLRKCAEVGCWTTCTHSLTMLLWDRADHAGLQNVKVACSGPLPL
jgi:hypothetical protein